jgi:hypothetical protein
VSRKMKEPVFAMRAPLEQPFFASASRLRFAARVGAYPTVPAKLALKTLPDTRDRTWARQGTGRGICRVAQKIAG